VYGGDWSRLLCNGCYGRLLSLYEIKAGTAPDEERAEELARVLLSTLKTDQHREAERLFKINESRSEHLSPASLRSAATAEYLAAPMDARPDLEWALVVSGLCRAVENFGDWQE
jgi:hypothetical protein